MIILDQNLLASSWNVSFGPSTSPTEKPRLTAVILEPLCAAIFFFLSVGLFNRKKQITEKS